MTCPSCGSENRAEARFCQSCGAGLARACPNGHAVAAGARFCDECGAAMADPAPAQAPAPLSAAPPTAAPQAVAPASERRLVSVLFADLVGFTGASERRDAEETRELLSRYFDSCRQVIERYGGTVEKFIGDAVMAVWGAPVAQEDDAERAVRAALELLSTVPELDPGLRARAGVLTGEAAVTLGASSEGMVAGDPVNTASRIQATAEPGSVLVGDSTKRATEAAIAYEDAGVHELKGKEEPVQLWRALRVVAGARGSQRSAGLEAPFVGRDRELRLVKELFHATGDEKRAQLVLVSGVAGIGKSRLAWEFEKYIDGLAADTFWHRGRCLSYGEGVAYWALAEMVRMRCGILEDEAAEPAREKLKLALSEYILDADEVAWVEPRLAHLLGLEDGAAGDEENLFSAWRILFERLADVSPTVLVFEDLQWADAGLLDFLEYLLDWSRNHPLYVLALARPEFAEQRSTWAGKRSFTQLYLEPLAPSAMDDLLTGLVPGLPDDLRARILERAEGVPLYAVETVRMLLDRGLLAREANVYRPTGPVDQLEVPETLQALVAARLDGLAPEERRIVQDGAVLGKTFTAQGLAALSGVPAHELEPLLASLLRKEILAVQADPRSPERGQYSFLQDIVKRVAYETLARSERKAKHLATAAFLQQAFGAEEDEVVEVVAAHYVSALETAPDAADADELRDQARTMLVRAAERAASLAANAEAQRAFGRAAELTDDPLVQADLLERAGVMALVGARGEESKELLERAIERFREVSATHAAARVEARLAETMWELGRIEHGLERMNRSYELLVQEEPDADLAALAAQLGRFLFFGGEPDAAMERLESALAMAESLVLPDVMAHALTSKGTVLFSTGRRLEGISLQRVGLETALEHDKPSAALRASFNLADSLSQSDRYGEAADVVRNGLAHARRVGNRYWEQLFLGQAYGFLALGEWDEALAMFGELPIDDWEQTRGAFQSGPLIVGTIGAHRGQLDSVLPTIRELAAMETSADEQEQSEYTCALARVRLAAGHADDALRLAEKAFAAREHFGFSAEQVKESFVTACEAALALGDQEKATELVAIVDGLAPGTSTHFLQAHASRFRARIADDADEADRLFRRATGLLRELSVPFYLAVVQTEHAEMLASAGLRGEAEALLAEAHETFERLRATPWVERVDAARTAAVEA